MRPTIHLATAALLVLAWAHAAAQERATDPDTREVMAYRLTMPKLKQLNQVYLDLQRQREADPAYQALLKKKQELAKLEAKDELSEAEQARMEQLQEEIDQAEQAEEGPDEDEPQSLSAMAARMAADRRIGGALERAGLAPREAATLQLAYLQAAFTVGLLESGTIKEIPKDASTENVKFLQANRAELESLAALLEKDQDQERE